MTGVYLYSFWHLMVVFEEDESLTFLRQPFWLSNHGITSKKPLNTEISRCSHLLALQLSALLNGLERGWMKHGL